MASLLIVWHSRTGGSRQMAEAAGGAARDETATVLKRADEAGPDDLLEADGYIRNYVALLDARKMGVPSTVFVEITLQAQADEVLEAFERAVARIPDVMECHLMAGTADYILKLVAENTEDFARIHRQYLTRLPGVAQMQSSFSLRTVFETTALPV